MEKGAITMYEDGSSSKEQREEMKEIPLDIIKRILIRLPVKSIIKSKLVSKPWCALISPASFAQTHLKFVSKNPHPDLISSSTYPIEICAKGSFDRHLWIPEPIRNHRCRFVVGSCNGLVCMKGDYDIIFVFNPATRESVSLPNPSYKFYKSQKLNFAFNHNTNEYKILHFYEELERSPTYAGRRMEVFTVGKDLSLWRQIEGGLPVFNVHRAINIGAAMHWETVKDSVIWVLFFDLSEENFGYIEAPKEKHENCESAIIDLNGRLSWVSVWPDRNGVMNLWTLNESEKDKSHRTLLLNIKLSALPPHVMLDDLLPFMFLECIHRNKIILAVSTRVSKVANYCFEHLKTA